MEVKSLNAIWLFLFVAGTVVAAARGNISAVTDAAMASARLGVETVFGLVGVMVLWLGFMRIAEQAGLIHSLARLLAPPFRLLFPSLNKDHPALGAMLMNVSANLLGLGSAATPFGLKAMQEMQKANGDPETATDAMCTFLALNTSSVTLVPATVIALRLQAGSLNATETVGATLVATVTSTVAALLADRLLRGLSKRRRR